MAETPKKVYWDACVWISLIKVDPGRYDACRYVIEQAKLGQLEIWTSAFTFAEVFKRSVNGATCALGVEDDLAFETLLAQDYIFVVQLDAEIGVEARRLLRKHSKIKKPADGVHIATAVISNVDEFHTYDQENLLPLTGLILRSDGRALQIIQPPANPAPGLFETVPLELDAVDVSEESQAERKAH